MWPFTIESGSGVRLVHADINHAVSIGTCSDQHLRCFDVPGVCGVHQRRKPHHRRAVDVGSTRNQSPNAGVMPLGDGPHQWSRLRHRGYCVDVRTAVQQRAHYLCVASVGGDHQGASDRSLVQRWDSHPLQAASWLPTHSHSQRLERGPSHHSRPPRLGLPRQPRAVPKCRHHPSAPPI